MSLERIKSLDELLAGIPERTPLQKLVEPLEAFVLAEMLAENKRLQSVEERLGLPYRTQLFVEMKEV